MLFSFWTGPLTWVERLCLTSMLANGHSVTVFSFGPLDVPSGVIVRDANEVLPKDRLIVHRQTGSPSVFADLFRYEGLRRGLGTWVDLDVLLLRNISGLGDHIFGLQDDRLIAIGVLRLPVSSPILRDILDCCSRRVIVAPHWKRQRQIRQRVAGAFGLHKTLEDLPWGTIGPKLLTYYARKHDIEPLPQTAFYPYPSKDFMVAFDPGVRVEDRFTSDTYAVHLWNERIKHLKGSPPPPGSFLARMCAKYEIATNHDLRDVA